MPNQFSTDAETGAVYGGYTLERLQQQYNIEASVPEMGAILRRYAEMSETVRSRRKALLDVKYGDGPGEKLDVFFAERKKLAPIVLFVHGGGWRSSSKEARAFPADFYCAAGAVFISIEYPLAPTHTLDQMADAVQAAIAWTSTNAPSFGGDASRIVLVGNSAGGHLAAIGATGSLRAHVAGLVTISGVFDMKPLQMTHANGWLHMDDVSALRHSPIHHIPKRPCPLFAFVGQDEPDEFRRQSRDFATRWRDNEGDAQFLEVDGQNHFSIIGLVGASGNPVSTAILQMCRIT